MRTIVLLISLTIASQASATTWESASQASATTWSFSTAFGWGWKFLGWNQVSNGWWGWGWGYGTPGWQWTTVTTAGTPPNMPNMTVKYATYNRIYGPDPIPSECVYLDSIGSKVPDSCCLNAPNLGDPVSFTPGGNGFTSRSDSDTAYACSPTLTTESYAFLPTEPKYIRNYFDCVNGVPTFAELCIPQGYILGESYPLTTTSASTLFENVNSTTCGCGQVYSGAGCYSAVQPFELFPSVPLQQVFFVLVAGSC